MKHEFATYAPQFKSMKTKIKLSDLPIKDDRPTTLWIISTVASGSILSIGLIYGILLLADLIFDK